MANQAGWTIGIDCHGPLLDTESAKSRLIRRLISRNRDALSPEELERIDARVHADPAYVARHVRGIPGATSLILQLHKDGHRIFLVSRSGTKACESIARWVRRQPSIASLDLPLLTTGREALKATLLRVDSFDFFLENNVREAEALVGIVGTVCLLTDRHNVAYSAERRGIVRVDSFRAFYELVKDAPCRLENRTA